MDSNMKNPATPPTLSPQDAAAVDALLEHGAGPAVTPGSPESGVAARIGAVAPSSVSADESQRRVRALLALMSACPAPEAPADLTARTVQVISEFKRRERAIEASQIAPTGRSFRFGEVAAMVAIMLIGASLLWPAMDRSRQDARQIACQSNLGLAGQAIGSYAVDYDDNLPRRGSWPGATWWNVGKHANVTDTAGRPIESNSAHLYTIVRKSYATADALTCPENPDAPHSDRMSPALNDWTSPTAVSFSYQNQFTASPIRASRAVTLPVLGDRNPHFVRRHAGNRPGFDRDVAFDAPSVQHGGRGQNILLGGGQAVWTQSPLFFNGDNIYLINGVDHYGGNEVPADPGDAFLTP